MFNEIRYINEAFDQVDTNTTKNKEVHYAYELENIAQAYHFTLTIDRLKTNYIHPVFGNFLPVKSASFNYTSFDSLQIPLGIYGDLPVLKRRSVGRLNLQLYDNYKDELATHIRNWINECFPGGKYVNYVSNIASTLTYTSYGVTGQRNQSYPLKYLVIPTDSYSVNRSYEENGPKILDFSVIVVGDMSAVRNIVEVAPRSVPSTPAAAATPTERGKEIKFSGNPNFGDPDLMNKTTPAA